MSGRWHGVGHAASGSRHTDGCSTAQAQAWRAQACEREQRVKSWQCRAAVCVREGDVGA